MATELFHANLADLTTDIREHVRNHRLECLIGVAAGFVLQSACACLHDENLAFSVGLLYESLLLASK